MTRLVLHIDSLVVDGEAPRDGRALERALAREIAARLSAGPDGWRASPRDPTSRRIADALGARLESAVAPASGEESREGPSARSGEGGAR